MIAKILVIVIVSICTYGTHHAFVNKHAYGGSQEDEGHGHQEEHHAHIHLKYEFKYRVKNGQTKDLKSQSEHRDDDIIKGEYCLHKPDGKVRNIIVKQSGFNDHVTNSELAEYPGYYHHY